MHIVSAVAFLGAALGTLSGTTPSGTATIAAGTLSGTTPAPPPSPLVGPSLHWLCGVFAGPGLLLFVGLSLHCRCQRLLVGCQSFQLGWLCGVVFAGPDLLLFVGLSLHCRCQSLSVGCENPPRRHHLVHQSGVDTS